MEIIYYEDKYLNSLNILLQAVFSVQKICKKKDDDIELICVDGNLVCGYLALNRCQNTLTGEIYFYVNYVCVTNDYRNMGIASRMFNRAFDICRDLGVGYLELTSNPRRIEAHALYEKLGFKIRETDVFRKVLE